MENGTSIFDSWMKSVHSAADRLDLAVALDHVSSQAAEKFGTRIWFARIHGRRWSYVAGLRSERPAWLSAARIPLSAEIGLVAESWGELSLREQVELCAFLGRLVTSRKIVVRWG